LPKTKKPAENRGLLKEPPPLPCVARSFEHVLQHVELAWLLSTSSKGMSATAATHPVIVFYYGSRTASNHEQGREIKF